jgi:hypothetical protein
MFKIGMDVSPPKESNSDRLLKCISKVINEQTEAHGPDAVPKMN